MEFIQGRYVPQGWADNDWDDAEQKRLEEEALRREEHRQIEAIIAASLADDGREPLNVKLPARF